MSITEIPALNRRSSSFKDDVDTYFGTIIPNFTTEMNTEIERINSMGAGSYSATSTTSLSVGTGSKSFTIQASKSFAVGQTVSVAYTTDASKFMLGRVTAYNTGTGAMTVNVSYVEGAGTYTAWTISVSALTSPWQIGDVRYAADPPGSDWLPCDGSIYLQSSYPALYAKLGLLADKPDHAKTFHIHSSGLGTDVRGAAWCGSQFVIVCSSYIYTYIPGNNYPIGVTHGLSGYTNMYYVASNGLTSGNITIIAQGGSGKAAAISTNQGNTWSTVTIPTGAPAGVACGKYSKRFFIWGSNYLVWSDNGTTWNSVTFTGYPYWMINTSGNNWMMADSATGVRTSTDNGVTWSAIIPHGLPFNSTAHQCATEVDGIVFAGGSGGGDGQHASIYRTTDNGVSWERMWVGAPAASANITYSLNACNGIMLAGFGVGTATATSKDKGVTWELTTHYKTNLSSICGSSWRCGDGGPVFLTYALLSDPAYTVAWSDYKLATYNTATQFCTPVVPAATGVKPYIKAL